MTIVLVTVLIAFTSDKLLANDIYITQSGNSLDLNITQDGENNSIGTSSTRASLDGDNTDITIVQETDGASIGLSVDGDNTTMIVKQKCHNGNLCNSDTMDIDITGNNNSMELGQGYNEETGTRLEIREGNWILERHDNANGQYWQLTLDNGNGYNIACQQGDAEFFDYRLGDGINSIYIRQSPG